MKLLHIFVTLILVLSSSFGADGKTLYKKCRGCHGVDGKHVPFERQEGVLAGREAVEMELIIKAISDGSYPGDKLNMIMKKLINKFSEEDIKNISIYIGSFKK